MRLWSIHPKYLDAKGLVALWREGLLAQKVLKGETVGYKHHPQLIRFKQLKNPLGAIATYLSYIVDEAEFRGYSFDRQKIVSKKIRSTVAVNSGQVDYEFSHLMQKLRVRSPEMYEKLRNSTYIKVHPMFVKKRGAIENWEVVTP